LIVKSAFFWALPTPSHKLSFQVIIPIQFVLFTLSAIIGSAILYGDFKETKFHQRLTFLYGCAATFLGVFVIAWAPSEDNSPLDFDDEQEGEDVDGETVDARAEERDRVESVLHAGGGAGGTGSVGRRRGHVGFPTPSPIVRHKPSLIGLSPAQAGFSTFLMAIVLICLSFIFTAFATCAYAATRSAGLLGSGGGAFADARIVKSAESN
jgi:hypothetical protein